MDEAHAALGEHRIPHRQGLINHQHLRLRLGEHGKGQPQLHPAGIGLHRLMHELTDVGKGEDRVQALTRLLFAEAEQGRVQKHVLETGELRIEAAAQLQQRRHAAPGAHTPLRGGEGAADQLQQGAFAAAIATDDRQGFTACAGKTHGAERPELAVVGPPASPECLLEPRLRAVVETEALAKPAHGNGRLLRICSDRPRGMVCQDAAVHRDRVPPGSLRPFDRNP